MHAVITIVSDTSGLEPESVNTRHTAGTGQDGIDRDGAVVVVTEQLDEFLAIFRAHADDFGIQSHLDAVAGERVGEDLRRVALLPRQKQRPILHDRGVCAETAKCLCHFATERAAADDQQAARQLGQVEDIGVGEIVGRD